MLMSNLNLKNDEILNQLKNSMKLIKFLRYLIEYLIIHFLFLIFRILGLKTQFYYQVFYLDLLVLYLDQKK